MKNELIFFLNETWIKWWPAIDAIYLFFIIILFIIFFMFSFTCCCNLFWMSGQMLRGKIDVDCFSSNRSSLLHQYRWLYFLFPRFMYVDWGVYDQSMKNGILLATALRRVGLPGNLNSAPQTIHFVLFCCNYDERNIFSHQFTHFTCGKKNIVFIIICFAIVRPRYENEK